MKMNLRNGFSLGWAAAFSAALVGCGGGGGGGDSGAAGMGSMRVALTDAPSCGYDHVYVTIEKIRVHQSSTASENDAGWSEIALDPAQRVDLLSLQNGVLAELGQMPLTPGRYQQLRLVLAANGAGAAAANSLVPTGGAERALDTPSAQQSGLKMNVDLDVQANKLVDLVLDFDACKSVVRAGNSGHYHLKPVASVIPRFISGVSGTLAAGWPAGTTQVSLQQSGTVVKATAPGSGGAFLLQPVSPGTYDLVAAAPGEATVVVTNVIVASETVTAVGGTLAATASATGTVSGKVTTATTPVDADTRALQALTMGHAIEVASSPVDETTGDYGHVLSLAAPLVAPYVAPPVALAFSADTAVAGKFRIEAISGGATKSVTPPALTASSPTSGNNDFTFP
jgi:hypothetical protein